jgi:hypothetical protein
VYPTKRYENGSAESGRKKLYMLAIRYHNLDRFTVNYHNSSYFTDSFSSLIL